MATDELCWLPATELAATIRRKKVSPVEVVDAVLGRIEKLNPTLNAYCTVTADAARRDAKAAERALMRRSTRLGSLHGVPFSIKDLIITKGVRTTWGTRLYADHVPEEDAPVVERLKAAGGILVGKTNTPMFGWIGATHNLLFGATRSPWNLDRTPGGSSGGAGAAVAAGMAPLAVGTDGGGSIRIPASFSGIFGLKPSYGRVPTYPPSGAWSLSHAGPMTRTVADAALMLNVLAGPDERDLYSLPPSGADYVKALRGTLRGLRVAWSLTLGFARAVDPEVAAVSERAARGFKALGCRVDAVDPAFPDPGDAWYAIFCGGIATRLAPYLVDRRADIDAGLARIIEETLRWPPTRYVQAWFDRFAFCDAARKFFATYDLLLTPTVACPPFEVGLDHPGEIAGTRVPEYGWIPFTYPFNMTGQPAASVPCGFTGEGLPIGLQIVGRRFDDATVLRAAACFEQVRPWADRKPPDPPARGGGPPGKARFARDPRPQGSGARRGRLASLAHRAKGDDMKIDEIKRILVVGAGQMGAQIAMQAALHGYTVTLNDLSVDILEKGMKSNRAQLDKRVAKGQMPQAQMDAAIGRVRLEPDLAQAARDADFVVEAIIERLPPKRELFSRLDGLCPAEAILVSNSSTLMISQIAGATKRPARCANMHWFYPPLVMRLVEVVKGRDTTEETAQLVAEVARRMGREPVILRKELPGFLVNRILRALAREAYYLLEEGVASFADIDKAVELGLNHPMGPFKLADFSGLDIGFNARLETYELTKDPKDLPPKALEMRVKRGDLGRKTGRGFYDYSTTPATPTPD